VEALNYTADLMITKEANVTSATVGAVITYWFNVTNTGNVNLSTLVVTDSRLGDISMSPTSLKPGDVARGSQTYTVQQDDVCADIVNNATANATDPCSQYTENISADVTVSTPYNADLMITKEANVTSTSVTSSGTPSMSPIPGMSISLISGSTIRSSVLSSPVPSTLNPTRGT